jgi:hypothetical protein
MNSISGIILGIIMIIVSIIFLYEGYNPKLKNLQIFIIDSGMFTLGSGEGAAGSPQPFRVGMKA